MDVNKDGSVQYEEFIDAWLGLCAELKEGLFRIKP